VPGFDVLYKQTVTLFNRINSVGEPVDGSHVLKTTETLWKPVLLENVHLIVDRSIIISAYGEQASDNAMLHVRYQQKGDGAYVDGMKYYQPKEWNQLGSHDGALTFQFGENFDFFIEGDKTSLGIVRDDDYRNGFFNYANKTYDNCFAISSVSKFNLIYHFEIGAK